MWSSSMRGVRMDAWRAGMRRLLPRRAEPVGERAANPWAQRSDRLIDAQLAAYRRQLAVRSTAVGAFVCPRCRLRLTPRLPTLAPRHCPRCLARHRVAVELQASEPRRHLTLAGGSG
jgi:hypothetical protein